MKVLNNVARIGNGLSVLFASMSIKLVFITNKHADRAYPVKRINFLSHLLRFATRQLNPNRGRPMTEDTSTNFDHKLDTSGLNCREPLMIVRNKVREMRQGERLLILATDPSTHRDFSNFCRFMGHTLEMAETGPLVNKYIIRKG